MNIQKKLVLAIGAAVIGINAIAVWHFLLSPMVNANSPPFETFQTQNGPFAIRVVASIETGPFVFSGANYVFESTAAGDEKWRPIMTFRHDGRVRIPTDQIYFVSDRIAFVFMGWMYAVTTDSGHSWSVWNAVNGMRGHWCCNYKYIQKVELGLDGTGTMFVDPDGGFRPKTRKLATKDFGRTWWADDNDEKR